MKKILVTGADGFVGRAVCDLFVANGYAVRGCVQKIGSKIEMPAGVEIIEVSDIRHCEIWPEILASVDVVVHLAARVHIMSDPSKDPLSEYRSINVEGTRSLAMAASEAGVKRFVYISSLGVNGDPKICHFDDIKRISENDEPNPQSYYSISKYETELVLQDISKKTGLEFTILRPPIIYGPGVKANFLRLMKLVKSGTPVPFKNFDNYKNMIYLENMADAIFKCAFHPGAVNEIFLVSDDECVSTPQLMTLIASSMRKKVRLFPFPLSILQSISTIFGHANIIEGVIDRLAGSMVIDNTKIKRMLGWVPPFKLDYGIEKTVRWYLLS